MKRSQINESIKQVMALAEKHGFQLPPFANWTPEEWQDKGRECDEIRDAMLGWDVTDFGRGDFEKIGLSLFTLRNGVYGSDKYTKPYAEKILVANEGQYTPYHFHWNKQEDIINRGGGNLLIQLYNSTEDEDMDMVNPVIVSIDGVKQLLVPGSIVKLTPGQSICLTQGLYHQFWAEPGYGPVLAGEVSMTNDDVNDNRFFEAGKRYMEIEEDEPAIRLLCNEYTKLPQTVLYTGAIMPGIGIGTFGSDRVDADTICAAVEGAIRAGYRSIDGASCYGNEKEMGQVYAKLFAEGVVKREDLFITSKVWNDMHGDGDVLLACAKTLKDLQLDYLDMYYVHWPFPNYHAPGCSVDVRNPDSVPFTVERFMKTWRQMERLVDMGLVKHIGFSNMTIPKMEAVLPLCRIKPAAIEMELHPCFQQQKLVDYCKAQGMAVVAFCPLGSPQRPERDMLPEDIADMEEPELKKIAEAHGVHPALICLKWASQRGTTPIPFSVKEKNYVANMKAIMEDPLTDEEMEIIKGLEKGNRLVKGQVFLWEGVDDWHVLWDETELLKNNL